MNLRQTGQTILDLLLVRLMEIITLNAAEVTLNFMGKLQYSNRVMQYSVK